MRAIKDVRLKNYDYRSNGFYFVTVVTNHRTPCLVGEFKDVVAQFIGRLCDTPGVSVDYWVMMPTHLHMILVLDGSALPLGEVVRRLKALTTRAIGRPLWQPSYYEHVIRSERALEKIRRYIENNPAAEAIDLGQIYERRPINRATTVQNRK